MSFHPVRLRKRLDPQSLVAAERHPVTGRLVPHGRRNKARSGSSAALARSGFSRATGALAVGAALTLVAASATAATKSGGTGHHSPRIPSTIADRSSAPSPPHSRPAAATLPAPCELVSQAAAQRAIGAPMQPSDNKPTSCLYAGTSSAPFRTLEIRYERSFNPDHVRRTLAAARVAATPVAGLGSGAFAHPAFRQTVNGVTQFDPAEAVVPVGPVTVIISAITIDESAGQLSDPAHDEAAAVAAAKAVLTPYVGR